MKKEQEENERQYKIVSGDLEDTRKIYEKIKEKNGKLQTVFLEMNDGYSLGSYGLVPIQYAKLVSARWSQLLNRTDEFDFRKMR